MKRNAEHVRRRRSGKGRKIGAMLFSLLMLISTLLSVMPGVSLTVRAEDGGAYNDYLVTTDANTGEDVDLEALQVYFNGVAWYVIEDESTALDAGTVTLLAKDPIGASVFINNGSSIDRNKFSGSTVKAYLDGLVAGTVTFGDSKSFKDVAAAIETIPSLTTKGYNSNDNYDTAKNVKLYLLSSEEADILPLNVGKCSMATCADFNCWWLRSPGGGDADVACVYGDKGYVYEYGDPVIALGVRPALKLNLSSVIFSSETRTFTPRSYISYLPEATDAAEALAEKLVKFNGLDWYIIEDNSTAVDAGTLTLFAKDPIGVSTFNDNLSDGNKYSTSKVKGYLDGLTAEGGSFEDVADAIETVTVTTEEFSSELPFYGTDIYDTATNVKLYLLSKREVTALSDSVRKCTQADDTASYWCLRSPARHDDGVSYVFCKDGIGYTSSENVNTLFSVRPALQLDLSAVIFDSSTKSFSVDYNAYLPKDDDDETALAKKVVKFNGIDWYIIEDNSTAANAGTLTLLAKDLIATMAFDNEPDSEGQYCNSYNDSQVKAYLDGLVNGTTYFGEQGGQKDFKDVAAAIKKTDLITYDYNSNTVEKERTRGAKLYLLSVDEVLNVPANVRAGAWWWLRSPGFDSDYACDVNSDGLANWGLYYDVAYVGGGVRPALQLDLESVIFTSDSKTFTVKLAPTVTTAPEALSLTYNGNEQELVTGGEAQGGTLYYALGEDAENEPEFDGLSEAADKNWSTDIPKASEVGSYPVWYMVKGDPDHCNIEAACITAEIKEQPAPPVSYYTVRFEMNGHGEAISSQKIRSGGKVRRPEDPVDEAYDFIDWYTDEECTKEYDFNKKVTRSFKLYAKWIEKNAETFTVSFDMQQHGEQVTPQTIVSGNAAVKPADPEAEGYDFGGWFTSAECKAEELYDFATPVTADLILYAKWTKKAEPQPGPVFHSAQDPVPVIDADTTELYLVKGQKFIIGKDWSVKKEDKASKALVSISKKSGQLKAKKDGTATIWNGERSLTLHISAPSVPKKLELQITADGAESKAIALTNPDGLPVYWYSASPDVATVDEEGMVTAVSAGKAKITAYINGSAYNCNVNVKEAVVAKERTLHMTAGGTKKLNIKGVKNPVWSSADEETAAFDKNKLIAKKAGETILTATTEDGTEYKVHLYVEDVTLTGEGLAPAKAANKYTLKLKAGVSTELSFASLDQAFVFKSSKPDSAFIDENGKVSARSAGKSKFTTKLNGKSITVNVVVKE